MDKADLIGKIAYANAPEGSKMVSRDIPGDATVTQLTRGSAAIMQARLLEEVLTDELHTLPDTLTAEHRGTIAGVIDDHFNGVSEAILIPAILETVETQRQTCLRKLTELLG